MATSSNAGKKNPSIKNKAKSDKPTIIKGGTDVSFLIIVLVLLAFGIAMMFSASYPTALDETGDGFY